MVFRSQNKDESYTILNILIIVFSIAHTIGILIPVEILIMLKPFPLIIMIIFISGKTIHRDRMVLEFVRGGLIMSLFGDIFLMANGDGIFMIGTGCFFVGHVLYCMAFAIGTHARDSSIRNKIIRASVVVGILFGFLINMYFLWDVMPNRILFPLYGFVLCLMNVFAIQRFEKTASFSYQVVITGALLFSVSDNLLGILKFRGIHSYLGSAIIMSSYFAGQYFLMQGAMLHSSLNHSIFGFLKNKEREQLLENDERRSFG